MDHSHLHRRHARAAFPDPAAIASAAADAFANAFANPFAAPEPTAAPEANPQQTMVSIVYVTAPKTFDGPVGGYTTVGPVIPSSTPKPAPTTKPASSIVADTSSAPTKSPSSSIHPTLKKSSSSTGLPASIVPSSSVATSIAILAASSGLSTTHHSSSVSATAAAASATSSASPSSGGMSVGGKAGLAIGLLLLVGTALALVLFCFKKRKDAAKAERLDDEKADVFVGAGRAASTRTTATAPRLSLRPVTQFFPNLGEKRASRGNALAMASTPISAPTDARKTASAWDRPAASQDPQNRNNPFGNHAEAIDATNANGPAVVDSVGPGGEILAGAAAGAVAAGAIGLARGASKRENAPKHLDFTRAGPFRGPPSPAGTEFSMSSESASSPALTGTGAAIAAAGGPANSSVHRVQLDFKPSMEDELGLRAGQLIRLLHEYDDGWALCIRLDRSQQGVVPRTCLSTRPVKPRPQQNGPRGPPPAGMRVPQQGRPMSPAMNQGPPRAMSPAGNRPMTPTGRPMTPTGRPMTPTGPQQPMHPQQGRPRSPSAAQMQGRRNSPPGPSPMNPFEGASSGPESRGPPAAAAGPVTRKPVGQAM